MTIIQPQVKDTVNIQLYAATFNNNEMYDYISNTKFNTLTCTKSNAQYSTWNCDFNIDFKIIGINTKAIVNCQILFNTANKTFQIINNIKDTNSDNSNYESANLSYIKTRNIEGYPLGSFWSGNGQTNIGDKGSFIGNNDNVLAHTWHTLYIQASKFDSYFGVSSLNPDLLDVDSGLV